MKNPRLLNFQCLNESLLLWLYTLPKIVGGQQRLQFLLVEPTSELVTFTTAEPVELLTWRRVVILLYLKIAFNK